MRLASACLVVLCAAFGAATVGGCGSTESNKSNSGADGSSSNGSGGDTSSNGTGGDTSSNGAGGDTSSNGAGGDTSSDGSGGSGGGDAASIECGGETCEGLSFGLAGIQDADACCPEGANEPVCGYDTETLQDFEFMIPTDCQPRNSPGELDESCPQSPDLGVSGILFNFPGCCLPTGKCGFMLDHIANLIRLDLGCIDSTEFLEDQEEPADCVPEGGEGGASN